MMIPADCAAQSAASRTAAPSTSAGRPPRGSPGRGTTSTLRTLGRLRFTYVFENPIYNTCDMLRPLGRLRCAYVFENLIENADIDTLWRGAGTTSIEPPWSQFTSDCRRWWHPPRPNNTCGVEQVQPLRRDGALAHVRRAFPSWMMRSTLTELEG
jgi:NADH:ubiquinone oxidoreductase subunit